MTQVHDPPALQAEWPTESAGPPPEKRSPFAFLRELPALLIIAFGIALLLKTFLVQAFFIPSESMVPTLEIKDRVLVNKLAYRFRDPRRGEVIVFIAEHFDEDRSLVQKVVDFLVEGLGVSAPRGEKDFIKRIIGLPGDTIEVDEQGVFITPPGGVRFQLDEPYIFDQEVQGPAQDPFVVPEDSYFVMGDNRGNSSDSRSSLGPIARADIIGKAFVRIWPANRLGLFNVPEYRPVAQRESAPEPSTTPKATRRRTSGAAPAQGLLPLPAIALVLAGGARPWRRGIRR